MSDAVTDDTHGGASRTRRTLDSPVMDALVGTRRFFTSGEGPADHRTLTQRGGRSADAFYRDRWSHDKVVRSTHGVNCTGSCSWKVHVKDGIISRLGRRVHRARRRRRPHDDDRVPAAARGTGSMTQTSS